MARWVWWNLRRMTGIITRTMGPFGRNWLIAWTRVAPSGSWAVRRKPVCHHP